MSKILKARKAAHQAVPGQWRLLALGAVAPLVIACRLCGTLPTPIFAAPTPIGALVPPPSETPMSPPTATSVQLTAARRIAFGSDRHDNWEIYTTNADGSGGTRLTDNPAVDWQPDWSPDGSRTAFPSYRDGPGEIYTMNTDGSEQTNLTNNTADDGGWPAW